MKRNWTDKEREILRNEYPVTATIKLAQKLNRTIYSVYTQANLMKLAKTDEYLKSKESGRLMHRDTRGLKTRFPKGHITWNQGTKGLTSANKTSFKKGCVPPNYRPVGSTRQDKDGYILIKVSNQPQWKLLHRKIWEDIHGTIPKGHTIIFKDGNKLNCKLDNLDIISRQQNMVRNTIHRYPEEIKNAIKTLSKLKKTINTHGTKQDRRPTQSPL